MRASDDLPANVAKESREFELSLWVEVRFRLLNQAHGMRSECRPIATKPSLVEDALNLQRG